MVGKLQVLCDSCDENPLVACRTGDALKGYLCPMSRNYDKGSGCHVLVTPEEYQKLLQDLHVAMGDNNPTLSPPPSPPPSSTSPSSGTSSVKANSKMSTTTSATGMSALSTLSRRMVGGFDSNMVVKRIPLIPSLSVKNACATTVCAVLCSFD